MMEAQSQEAVRQEGSLSVFLDLSPLRRKEGNPQGAKRIFLKCDIQHFLRFSLNDMTCFFVEIYCAFTVFSWRKKGTSLFMLSDGLLEH